MSVNGFFNWQAIHNEKVVPAAFVFQSLRGYSQIICGKEIVAYWILRIAFKLAFHCCRHQPLSPPLCL